MKKMIKEFKDFAVKGNVIDLAVAVVIGAAFGKITASLVNDIIMPLVGIVMGGIDFTALSIEIGAATVAYGKFIQSVLDFVIIAFMIFLLVKVMNNLNKKEEKKDAAAKPTRDIVLLEEIRDLLKK